MSATTARCTSSSSSGFINRSRTNFKGTYHQIVSECVDAVLNESNLVSYYRFYNPNSTTVGTLCKMSMSCFVFFYFISLGTMFSCLHRNVQKFLNGTVCHMFVG